MKQIDFVDLFDRQNQRQEIDSFLNSFDVNNLQQSKGLYIIGQPGCGKTEFVKSVISKEKYDIIFYDANDTRTKTAIPEIIGDRMSNINVLGMFYKKKRQLVIIMDEMDYMGSGDKGGIKELIKYVRAKKTRKQLSEPQTSTPVIFIGSNDNDKKIKELINVCKLVHLKKPTDTQVREYIKYKLPDIEEHYLESLVYYSGGNLRKLNIIFEIYTKNPENFAKTLDCMITKCNYNLFTKTVVNELYKKYVPISEYTKIVKETDRTTLGLLWHENVGGIISNNNALYKKILDNLCLSDYIDRIIFQNQIWELSELNSYIKTFYNNYLLHTEIKKFTPPSEIIFTKVLTKYSTEYNNYCFLQQIEQKMFCEKDKILHLFMNKTDEELSNLFYLSQLDVDRMKRFINNGEFSFVN
jgi:energy-coupling factor transporter ATP-binding protein EcfA2